VSTQVFKTLDLQKMPLTKAGCEKIFTDTISAAKSERPGLQEAVAFCAKGHVGRFWKLDRLGRSLKHLIETVTALHPKKNRLRSLTENHRYDYKYGQTYLSCLWCLGRI